jgi:ribosomal protein S18 acetylase RimI-like enzyme
MVEHFLNNPVYHALRSGDADLGYGNDRAKYFDQQVSPFAGFADDHEKGFDELYNLLPSGRKILYATRKIIAKPGGWELRHEIKGLQFLFNEKTTTVQSHQLMPLGNEHVDEMIALARLTKPGPFDKRTIDFGHYYGIFDNAQLVAMAGQRLHVYNYTEVSAVCTHPDHLGKGYAAALIRQQSDIICSSGQIPFLHVRNDNERAILLYERLGFRKNGVMNFYFLRRKESKGDAE